MAGSRAIIRSLAKKKWSRGAPDADLPAMDRRAFFVATAGLLAAPVPEAVPAEQPSSVYRLVCLYYGSPAEAAQRVPALRTGLPRAMNPSSRRTLPWCMVVPLGAEVLVRQIRLAILITVALATPFDAPAGQAVDGWYLMEPPVDETSNLGYGVLDQAPLNQWKRIAAFSTEAACEANRKQAVQASRDEVLRLSKTSPLPKLDIFKGAYRDSRLAGVSTCVSADDAQLRSGPPR